MKLTDALDGILRTLVTTGREPLHADPPAVVPAPPPAPVAPPLVETTPVPAPAAARREAGQRLETATRAAEQLGLGFHLGSAIERIATAAAAGSEGKGSLEEASWLIERHLAQLEGTPGDPDLQRTLRRLAREGDTIAGLQAIASALGEPELEPEPLPAALAAPPALPAAASPENGQPAAPPPQPTIRRELAVSAARAGIAVVAIVVAVLLLTLIAQWR